MIKAEADYTRVDGVRCELTFEETQQEGSNYIGVGCTVAKANISQRFQFVSIKNLKGVPACMRIKVIDEDEMIVDFRSDYLGKYFNYTDLKGEVYTGRFTNGVVYVNEYIQQLETMLGQPL